MTRSLKRQMRKQSEKRRMEADAKLLAYLDRMGAAFSKATDVHPTECILVHEVDYKDGKKQTKYWYEAFEKKAKTADFHPDVEYLFQAVGALTQLWQSNEHNDDAFRDVMDNLCDLMNKYKEETNVEEIAEAIGLKKQRDTDSNTADAPLPAGQATEPTPDADPAQPDSN